MTQADAPIRSLRDPRRPDPASLESLNEALVESMTDGVCIIRLIFDERGWPIDYLFVQANAAFQVQSGLSDPRCKTIRELVPGFEMHWIEKYAQVAASGVAARFEVEVLSIGGRYDIRAFVPRGFPPHHVAVVFTNTTERHLIESRLQASEERQAFVLKLQDRLRLLDDSDAIQLEAASALGLQWIPRALPRSCPTSFTTRPSSRRRGAPSC